MRVVHERRPEMAIERLVLAIGPNDHDDVDDLIDTAIDVAGPADATVYVLHVFTGDQYEELAAQLDVDPTTASVGPGDLAKRHETVQTAVDRLEREGIETEVRGVTGGDPADGVLRVLEDVGADMVLIGGQQRTPAGKALFGDHAQQILLNASRPVVYVKRE